MKINKSKMTLIKVISIATLIVICCIVMFAYIQYNDYKIYESKYIEISDSIRNELDSYIETVLLENKRKAESCTKIYSSIIHSKLLEEYSNDHNQLEHDITFPNANSKLSKVLDSTLNGVFINDDNNSNKPLVISLDKIVWNRSMYITDKRASSLDYFINNHYNKDLCVQAINSIKDMNCSKNNLIFWEYTKPATSDHKMITKMNMDELLTVFHDEGIDGLKTYEILVPVYITKDGDVFGTKDLDSIGNKVKNYKITIIQRVNMYDALKQYDSNIVYYDSQISKIASDISTNKKERAKTMEESIIIIIFILVASGCLQNKIYIENK